MASPRLRHRRGSMELPTNMLSDVFHLKEELNRLPKDISLECNEHRDKIHDLINEFKNYRLVLYSLRGAIITGGIGMVLSVLSFFVINDEVSEIFARAGAALSVVSLLFVAFGRYRKTQHKKNFKRTIEEELKGFQDKINPIIDIMEKICQRTEEILRDTLLSDNKAQALSEHFAYCFEKKQLFQEKESEMVSKMMHLSGNLSEMITKVSSVPDILKEIIEDNKRLHGKSAKPTPEQIHKRELKEKVEKFINEMQKGICTLKNGVKSISQISEEISNILK
ncbi:uncharacterized protein LOC127159303 [Labeo rohita]|uniref:uncharacterized protein LOC127159303 n=1 Tax=Labeo rohita TaxID=84645 RepID=UPI0021E2CC28|nr:uncharacterized protein LOC127159303 [Labeo rohita]